MALCLDCSERYECKSICETVKKEITGRGKTASRKPKTYLVDFSHIEDTHQALNPFQIGVLHTIKNLTSNIKEQLTTKFMIQEAIAKTLSSNEKQVIRLFMERYKQKEIAEKLGISQPRVNFLLKRALKKLKNFLKGVIKQAKNLYYQ